MNDQELEQKAKLALDESSQALSPEIQRQLHQARQTAMAQHASNKPAISNWFNRPVLGFSLAASFCAVIAFNYPIDQEVHYPQAANLAMDDFLLVSQLDETDMEIVEDLEFAYWLSEQLEHETFTDEQSSDELRNG